MPLAPGLSVRTLVRPGGSLITVVVRRSRNAAAPANRSSADGDPNPPKANGKPRRLSPVPSDGAANPEGFSHPVARALWALGGRVRTVGRGDVLLDGRRAALPRVVAEANRCLAAAGRPVIPYPGVGTEGGL